jgi:hypothetical protein
VIKDDISHLVADAVKRAQDAGDLPAVPVPDAFRERIAAFEEG